MKYIIFYCFNLLLSQNFDYKDDDFDLFFKRSMHLDSNIKWELIKVNNNLSIYNYKDKKITIPAIKVEITDSVNFLYMKQAITNVKKHTDFMQDSYLIISEPLKNDFKDFYNYKNVVYYDTYQYLDLPYITDRHYVARAHIIENDYIIRINWELLSFNNYSFFIDNIDKNEKNIFIENGFGFWEIEKIDSNMSKVTYSIYLNPQGWIPSFIVNLSNLKVIPNTAINMINEAKRLQKLN